MPLKAILFDFDGVIADTDNHHIAAWQRTLSTMGWQVVDDVAALATEIDDRQFLAELFAKHGFPPDKIDDWVRRKQLLDSTNAPRFTQALSGSGGSDPEAPRKSPIGGRFWHVARKHPGRPRLLRARRLLRVDRRQRGRDIDKTRSRTPISCVATAPAGARSTVAIEDSPTGLASARAAGIPVIAVGHRHPFSDWVGDAIYISGLEPIDGLLQHLGLSD